MDIKCKGLKCLLTTDYENLTKKCLNFCRVCSSRRIFFSFKAGADSYGYYRHLTFACGTGLIIATTYWQPLCSENKFSTFSPSISFNPPDNTETCYPLITEKLRLGEIKYSPKVWHHGYCTGSMETQALVLALKPVSWRHYRIVIRTVDFGPSCLGSTPAV